MGPVLNMIQAPKTSSKVIWHRPFLDNMCYCPVGNGFESSVMNTHKTIFEYCLLEFAFASENKINK